jgi:replicative DNA helicase
VPSSPSRTSPSTRASCTARRRCDASSRRAQEIAAHGYGEYGDVDEFIDQAERAIFEIAQRSEKSSYEGVQRILGRTVKALEKRYDRKQAITGVPSGYHKLDAMTSGFQPSDLIIIAARPSMGKTSLVMNAVQNAAIEFGVPALVFSLEMSKESLVERLLCSEARVDSTRLRGGFLEQRDWIMHHEGREPHQRGADLHRRQGAPTLLEIRAKARRWRSDPNHLQEPDQHGVIVSTTCSSSTAAPRRTNRTASARSPRSAAGSRRWPRSCACRSSRCRSSTAPSSRAATSGR